jgi:hypothetical protein
MSDEQAGPFAENNVLSTRLAFSGAVLFCLTLVSTQGLAQTWTQSSSAARIWEALAMSADGKTQAAVDYTSAVFVSTNAGVNWFSNSVRFYTNLPGTWTGGMACSADASRLFVADAYGLLAVSTNLGKSWARSGGAPGADFQHAACSADGQILATADLYGGSLGGVTISTNAGANWQRFSVPFPDANFGLWPVALSADGGLLATAAGGDNHGPIYLSKNLGHTWAQSLLTNDYWYSIVASADGRQLVAASFRDAFSSPGRIFTSADAGATWAPSSAPRLQWFNVASSADGTRLFAVTSTTIYSSTNSGNTWTTNNAPATNDWYCIATSADGGRSAASGSFSASVSGRIFTSQTKLPPRLTIASAQDTLNLSWIIPSQDFGLQQKADLAGTNWTDADLAPVVNFSNLHHEVIINPRPTTNVFFRLRSLP